MTRPIYDHPKTHVLDKPLSVFAACSSSNVLFIPNVCIRAASVFEYISVSPPELVSSIFPCQTLPSIKTIPALISIGIND